MREPFTNYLFGFGVSVVVHGSILVPLLQYSPPPRSRVTEFEIRVANATHVEPIPPQTPAPVFPVKTPVPRETKQPKVPVTPPVRTPVRVKETSPAPQRGNEQNAIQGRNEDGQRSDRTGNTGSRRTTIISDSTLYSSSRSSSSRRATTIVTDEHGTLEVPGSPTSRRSVIVAPLGDENGSANDPAGSQRRSSTVISDSGVGASPAPNGGPSTGTKHSGPAATRGSARGYFQISKAVIDTTIQAMGARSICETDVGDLKIRISIQASDSDLWVDGLGSEITQSEVYKALAALRRGNCR